MASSAFDRWVAIADIALGESDIDAPFATYDDLMRLQKEAKALSKKVKNQIAKAESMKRDVLDNRELLKIRATNLKTIIEKLLDIPSQQQALNIEPIAVIDRPASNPASASSSSSSKSSSSPQPAIPPTAAQGKKTVVIVPGGGDQSPQQPDIPEQVSPNTGDSQNNGLSNGGLIVPN